MLSSKELALWQWLLHFATLQVSSCVCPHGTGFIATTVETSLHCGSRALSVRGPALRQHCPNLLHSGHCLAAVFWDHPYNTSCRCLPHRQFQFTFVTRGHALRQRLPHATSATCFTAAAVVNVPPVGVGRLPSLGGMLYGSGIAGVCGRPRATAAGSEPAALPTSGRVCH